MKKITIIFSLAAVLLAGCTKDVTYDAPLTLSAQRNVLTDAEGSTPVIVYANEAWTATLSEDCDWAHIDRTEGDGLGQVIFSYDANTSIVRRAVITVKSGSAVKAIEMIQKSGSDAVFAFTSEKWDVAGCSGTAHLPFTSLIPENETGSIEVSVTPEDCGWIGGISVFKDELMFDIDSNTSGSDRSVNISISYTDVLGENTVAKTTITQSMEMPKVIFTGSADLSWEAAQFPVTFSTNLGLFMPQLLQGTNSNAPWCKVSHTDRHKGELTLTVGENTSGSSRQGRITMSYTDNDGKSHSFYYIILQKKQ